MIVAVGKPRNPALAAAIGEYERRAAHYWPLEVHEVREEPAKSVSADLVREREGSRLSDVVPQSAHLVACDPGGVSKTSEEFSAWLQRERERARTRLSLAPWTLPHELARLVLAEQLYRAGSIVKREPYHK